MVDMLFERTDTRRIVASVDDANVASIPVIETLGFRYEGIARQASLVRGEWLDETGFAIVRDDSAAWLSRPRLSPERVELVELVHDNAAAVRRADDAPLPAAVRRPDGGVVPSRVAPGEVDGALCGAVVRGVAADGVPVGFVMLTVVTENFPEPYLWRLLIDR